ncbi:cation-transporting P-type ATPase [Clostridium beijerinckii]|uniref:Magnesium-transporting ATPase (P-type) n=1 Tax=Clostridium beijerinckii TaxID=1520 RepID=A0AAX0B3U1_CLOBE|nr:cation-transporting P-type ATPase [Clostridium beijerinckii]MBA8936389.1 magnesium-transporting ATPase (P-type) [Clostridium beijerinckii]NRT89549.1 magnesium-transporting ATPase (P-type) [Clostridium beijerinckii]NRU41142.1 magnesium-transporting ATPase (P-type) [Clostridium beijerinckii]NSA95583.1 magnesium-transporting ATPase (P-type) [Clostridium beijerinckii]NYC75006.1 magnesium-transporting ATPase (P-type) [Clostridium beijerinckii]
MEKYCNNSWAQIVELLNSNVQNGLSENDCEALRLKYGTNKIDLPSGNKIYKHILNALKQKSIIINLIITIILFVFEHYLFGIITALILLLNLILIVMHTIKRDKEIGALERLNSADTVVIRDGAQKIIKSEELVMGDIVKINKDSVIPADIRIISANEIKVDEKSITGEAFYKEKFESKIIGNIFSLTDMKNILFKGSIIKSGSGLGIVISTGNSTQLGRMLTMLTYASNRKHNFGTMISKLLERYLLIYFLGIIIIGSYFVYTGQDANKNYISTALFALGCFPVTIIAKLVFNNIIKSFRNENIEIINFSVFNLIKDVNILFLDKVGAISKKEMIVKKLFINDNLISTEDPYVKETTFDRIVEISLICNNAIYNPSDDSGKGELDELAFLSYAARKKIYKAAIDSRNSKILDIPMDSDKRFSTVVSKFNNRYRANTRGNVDDVLEQCTHVMIEGIEKEITDEYKAKIKEVDMNLSIEGLITEGFAYRNFTYEPSKSENIESNMVFVGIIGLENPLEENLENTINRIKDKAIVPILFTEESKLSAITNAKMANIIKNNNQVVAGIELDSLNHQELKDLLCRVRVFCRVNPEIKSKIVSLFIKDGHKVATTGETLGDLPALNLSNVGIGKGKASTIVKKVSDVYIKENYLDGFFKIRDFSRVFDRNIDRGFKMYFMALFSELITLMGSIIMGQTESLDFGNVVAINGVLFIPLSLIILLKKGRDITRNEMIVRSFVLSIITMVSIYKLGDKEAAIVTLAILSIGILLFTLFNSSISIRKFSNELIMPVISLLVIIIAVISMILINGVLITDIIGIEIAASIIFLLIFEILARKWQNSLMR